MARKKKKSKNDSVTVDFAGVEGKRVIVPDGDWPVKVEKVTAEEGENYPYLKWVFAVNKKGKFDGKKLFLNTSLAPQALWNLRNLLEVIGVEVPDEEMDLDLEEYVDQELIVSVEIEKHEGRKQSRIVDFVSSEEGDSDDDEEDVEVSDDDDEGSDSSDEDEDDDEDEKPNKKGKKSKKSDDDDEDEEDEDDESEDEDEEPRKKKSKVSKRKDAEDDDEDEDEETEKLTSDDVQGMKPKQLKKVISDNDLDVDLSEFRTIGKKRNAVVDALEEAGLLDE